MGAGDKGVKVKAVVYSLSPLQQDTLPGMFRDMLGKPWIKTYVHWDSLLVIGIVGGTYWYATNYKKKENLAHRY